MYYILLISLFFILSSIVYQDYRYRAIDIYSLGGFCIVSFGYSLLENGVTNSLNYFFLILLFIVFQLIVLTIFYSIKNKRLSFIFDVQLGWGDVFFWMGLAFHFSILNFLVFHILSLLLIIIFSMIKKYKTIPLAGGQAFILMFLLFFDNYIIKINHYDDLYIINYLF